MASPLTSLLALRRDPRLLKLPPFLSACLVLVGIVWLLLLPLDEYSRSTYISENALLPGQVHTYFAGSEQNVFNAYKYEVLSVTGKPQEEISAKLREILLSSGLKVASQKYRYNVAGNEYAGENVYGILHAPRGDATEAIVLVAAWINMDGQLNTHGVTLALTLTRYFKRWSLWSKDIIFLFTSDSSTSPQAWVEAYHDNHNPNQVEPLPLKSGALEGAIVVDNPLDHRFESIHISYDGINGQLPNLDLFNTAVSVATGQHGMGAVLQRMWKHGDSYRERLLTMLRGMANQGLGHATGPHSCFIPYHVDAITITATGEGREDDMAFGRMFESLFRSLNNLMEHFHQSFFLYLILHPKRFVSIGTYLPSAMMVAANFSIMAIALWIVTGRPPKSVEVAKSVKGSKGKKAKGEFEVVKKGEDIALVAKQELTIEERHLFLPALLIISLHFLGVIPLYLFNNITQSQFTPTLLLFTATNVILPTLLRPLLRNYTAQQIVLLKCFSLLLLGMFIATLATVNFSLAFIIGLLSSPLTFVGVFPAETATEIPATPSLARRIAENVVLQVLAPPIVLFSACLVFGVTVDKVLGEAAFGWHVWGMWTHVIVWCVWWPAWLAGGIAVAPELL